MKSYVLVFFLTIFRLQRIFQQ